MVQSLAKPLRLGEPKPGVEAERLRLRGQAPGAERELEPGLFAVKDPKGRFRIPCSCRSAPHPRPVPQAVAELHGGDVGIRLIGEEDGLVGTARVEDS